MQSWRVVLLSLTCASVLVLIYRLLCCPHQVRSYKPYIPLNETSAASTVAPLPLDGRLFDLDNFEFLTDHDCNGSSPLVLALVHSAPRNSYNRDAIRRTWGKDIQVFFLVGQTHHSLEDEERRHNDLIRGTFKDSYRNMSYKHAMGLKWVSSKCPTVKYVLKTDDDVFVDAEAFKEWLLQVSPHGARNLMACRVERNALVKRSFRSKWRVTPNEFPGRYYPNYCLGWVIVYSPDVMQTLYTESVKSPYFWIDDVFITGILAEKVNLTHLHLGDLATSDEQAVSLVANGYGDRTSFFYLTTPDMFDKLNEALTRFSFRHVGV